MAQVGTSISNAASATPWARRFAPSTVIFYGGLCLNLLRHPGWGRAQETFGEDPYLLGEMAVATLEGVQRNNVMACAKHYALNSIEMARTKLNVNVDERTLREVYLPHFNRAVDGGVAAFMSSYNRVRGDYAGENAYLLRKILKDEWGFRGFVISDFFTGVYDGAKGANAGLDLEMPDTKAYGKCLDRRRRKRGRSPRIHRRFGSPHPSSQN